ncbi:hypothetical protein FACS1894181_02860 [Bacteroidia bacterium]|nr:hypothetical protein FACS1894181_02860 [Bacteroidia bacterium]
MDMFGIIDYVFKAVESAGTGFKVYKDNSVTGETSNHITVRTTGVSYQDYVNKAPAVNVNIFVKRNSNGTTQRGVMKDISRKVIESLENIHTPVGLYWKSRIAWIEPMGEAKEGFDCTNIRLEVITEK